MVDRKSDDQNPPKQGPEATPDMTEPIEDPILQATFQQLPHVQVPSSFLPNVMFRVYETHHRARLSPRFALAAVLILTLITFGLVAMDVQAIVESQGLASFSEGLSHKSAQVSTRLGEVFDGIGGVLTATWHIVVGAFLRFSSATPIVVQLMIYIGLVVGAILIKKWLSEG